MKTPLDVLESLGFYRVDLPERYPTSTGSVFTEISEQPLGSQFEDQNIFFFDILYLEYVIDILETPVKALQKILENGTLRN